MTKISSLTALTGAGVDGTADLFPIVDMSEAGSARNKKITIDEAKLSFNLGTAADLDIDTDDTLAADSDSLIPTQQAVKAYVDGNIGTPITELDDVPDVNAPSPANGDVLTWDSTPGEWVSAAPTGGSNALDDLTDVDAPTPSDGDVLTFDSGSGDWVPAAPSGGGSFSGAMAKKSADQTAANYSAGVAVAWDAEVYDTNAFHDNVTNNSRLTVPSGASYVRVGCSLDTQAVTANINTIIDIAKNGSASFNGAASYSGSASGIGPRVTVTTGPVPVTPGDYFEVVLTTSDTSITVAAATSNFWMEVVG